MFLLRPVFEELKKIKMCEYDCSNSPQTLSLAAFAQPGNYEKRTLKLTMSSLPPATEIRLAMPFMLGFYMIISILTAFLRWPATLLCMTNLLRL